MLAVHRQITVRQRVVVLYMALSAALFIGYFVLPEPGSTLCYLALSLLVVVGIVAGLVLNQPRAARPWLLLAAGQTAYLIGDITWYWDYLPTMTAPVAPHLSDAWYLMGYPLIAIGVLLFIRARQPRYRLTAALDALVLGVAGVLILWIVGMDGFVHDESMPLAGRAVLLAYPIVDVVILAAAVYLLLTIRQARSAFILLVSSLAALAAADLLYLVIPDEALATTISDVLWLSSYVLFGLTALVGSMVDLTEPSETPAAPESTARLVLLAAAITVLPMFALYQKFYLNHQDLAITGISGVIMLVAIILRMRELSAVHRRTESRYASLLANASDAFAIVTADGRLTYASPASDRVLGYQPGAMVARSLLEFVHPQAVAQTSDTLRAVAGQPGAQRETELRVQRGDGEWRWLSVIATNRTDDPIVSGIVLNLRDVTERRETEGRLDLQARVLDEVQHAVLVTDGQGRITYANRAAENLFGWSATEVVGRPLVGIGLTADKVRAEQLLAGLNTSGRMSGEYELKRVDGSALTAIVTSSAMNDSDGQLRGLIIVMVDITDRKQLEQRLQEQAFTDALTGLANRALFLDRVEHVLARRPRTGAKNTPAVLFLDIDDFKTVNDSMGHFAGDELLVLLARRLTSVIRPTDTAARLGGDEFAVLLEDASLAEAERVAQRVLAELAEPVRLADRDVHISASIGIAAPRPHSSTSADELLRDADLAMYRAKEHLQGSYAVYQPGMHEAALRRLELKADLQHAIENDGLSLEYQPIIRLEDGVVVGAEALLRWSHPERGRVPVAETLALAEAAGLIIPLGGWVLDRACRLASQLRATMKGTPGPPLFVSVNASARELLDPTYPALVSAALSVSRLPAEALAIEITENDLMQESEAAVDALRRLKDLGVRLAIDDFGTGYSSLAYLARFPIDVLKIDRTFVSTQAAGEEGAIARAIIDLAGSLGLDVIAEGIEREVDRQLMATLGAGYGQGYFLGRPMTAARLLSQLCASLRPPRVRRERRPRVSTATT